MIGIDTFSWQKILLLRKERQWKAAMDDLIDQIECFITIEGKKEFEHRFPEDIDLLNNIAILPVLKSEKYHIFLEDFDATDASLLEYNEKRGYRIITEDRPMIAEGVTSKKNIIFLIDFLYELHKAYDFFTSREIYQLVQIFREWKNISKKKAKDIRNRLGDVNA